MITTFTLVAIAALAQAPDFQVVHSARGATPVAFVHVVEVGPQLRIDVYSDTGRLAVWQDGVVTPGPPLRLEVGQRFMHSPRHEFVGILQHGYPCLAGTGISRLAEWTQLHLPEGFPGLGFPKWPPFPPGPGPDPVFEVAGASIVELGPSARLAAALEAVPHPNHPGLGRLFRRIDPNSSEFTATGQFEFTSRGDFQASSDGGLFAHTEGKVLRLIDSRGMERERVELNGRAFLSPNARWLALVSGSTVEFKRVDAEGHLSEDTTVLDSNMAPTQVQFLGDRALIYGGARATLVDASTGQNLWSRQAVRGCFSSADLLEPAEGRLLIALGTIDVLSAPRRDKGKHAPGAALTEYEVFELATDESLVRSSSSVQRWTHVQPWVRLAGIPPRLIAVTADEVRISPPIP